MSLRRSSVLLLALAATGCMGGSPPEAVPEARVAKAPARAFAELRVSSGPELDYVDPALALTAASWTLLWQVHVGLVTFRHAPGPAGTQIVPALADDLPEISDDGLVYTFRLREGLAYSDGRPVRAGDVRYAIERLRRIESPGAHWFDVVREIEADDAARTVEFRLAEPQPDFLHLLASPLAAPVPRGTPPLEQRRRLLPSTGPYRVELFMPRQEVVLVRNPRFRPVPGVPAGNAARIHVSLSGGGTADYELRGGGPQLSYVFLNTQLPPFDRLEVRRAVAFALDRRPLAAAVGDDARPTENVLPPEVPGYERHLVYRRSLPRARRLVRLAEAGGMRVTVWSTAGPAGRELAEQLRQIGLTVRHRRLPAAEFYRVVGGRTPRAQIGVASWSSPLPHPFRWFDALLNGDRLGQAPNTNLSYADDPELNELLADLRLRPLLTEDVVPAWAELDRLAVGRALILPFAVESPEGVAGPRLDPSCRAGHAVFGVDLARACTKRGR
ncbi:MAG: ABC transporter substrate-binding protein [Gaiellaceae bacterium]